jgi:hypothetical protein
MMGSLLLRHVLHRRRLVPRALARSASSALSHCWRAAAAYYAASRVAEERWRVHVSEGTHALPGPHGRHAREARA